MNRVALAVLGVVLVVAVLVLVARQGGQEGPARATSDAALEAASLAAEEPYDAAGDIVLEVKERELGDGALNQQSIRVEHPDPAVGAKLREWLEVRETTALARGAAISCHAQTAKTSFISITCSSLDPTPSGATLDGGAEPAALAESAEAGAHDGGAPSRPTVKYESLTIRVVRGQVKELALSDVLLPDAGEAEVMAACKKSADPPLPCVWPPTSFAVSPGGTLFLCHASNCVDIDGDSALLRPELR